MEFLFGLDMLRRHQAVIDLQKNVLRVGPQEVPFLQEKDIPHLRMQNLEDLQQSQLDQEMSEIQSPTTNNSNKPTTNTTTTTVPTSSNSTTTSNNNSNNNNNNNNNRNNSNNNNTNNNRTTNASTGRPQTNTNSTAQTSRAIKEEDITTLMRSFSCTRQEAMQVLTITGGNVELAANLLFQAASGLGFD